MRKILTFALLICTFAMATAQENEYRQELNKLLKTVWGIAGVGNTFNSESFTAIFMAQLNEMPNTPYKTTAEKSQAAAKLAQKYYAEQGCNDIIEILAPAYQKHLSLNDLKEYNKLLSEDKKLFEAGNKLADKSVIESMTAEITQGMMSSMMKIAQGEAPESLLTAAEKENEFYKAIEEYCNVCELTKTTIKAFTSAIPTMQDENQKKIFESIIEYLTNEIPAAYYKGCVGKVNVEDVKYVTNFYKSPLGQKILAGSWDITRDPITIGTAMMQKSNEWLSKQDLNAL